MLWRTAWGEGSSPAGKASRSGGGRREGPLGSGRAAVLSRGRGYPQVGALDVGPAQPGVAAEALLRSQALDCRSVRCELPVEVAVDQRAQIGARDLLQEPQLRAAGPQFAETAPIERSGHDAHAAVDGPHARAERGLLAQPRLRSGAR